MTSSDVAWHASDVCGPRGQAVAAEHDAPQAGVVGGQGRDLQAQLEARAAPRHPGQLAAEALLGERLAVGGGREGDHRVGVEVVDVGGVDQRVHRGVDRRGGAAARPAAVLERVDHLVLVVDPAVHAPQRPHPVEAQGGQALGPERAEVAARPLHVQHVGLRPGHRVDDRGLARGVAAAVVGDPRVGPEGVRACHQGVDLGWPGCVQRHLLSCQSRWKTTSSSRIIWSAGRPSPSKYGAISACHRSLTGSAAMAACASASVPGVST